jgi:acetyl esterase/lipase
MRLKFKHHHRIPNKYRLILYIGLGFLVMVAFGWVVKNNLSRVETLQTLADTQRSIHYCNSNDPSQALDLYRPKGKEKESVPLLVYIHGGGWRSGSKNNKLISTYGPIFIRHGIAVASINYRLTSPNPYPDQNNDVACALTYLSEHAADLKINADKSIFFGESAGGQLAAFAALNIPYKNYDYEAPIGVIDFYGVSDFSKIIEGAHPDFNARRYLGSKYNQVATPASPTTYVTKKAPQFLFVHGTNDRIVPISQSKGLYDLLVKSGIDAEYLAIPGVKHGFTGPELPTDNYKTIQDSLTSFLRETVQR